MVLLGIGFGAWDSEQKVGHLKSGEQLKKAREEIRGHTSDDGMFPEIKTSENR